MTGCQAEQDDDSDAADHRIRYWVCHPFAMKEQVLAASSGF